MSTKRVSVQEAQARLPELVDFVSKGNRVVILKDEEPLAEIVGINAPKKGKRVLGLNQGKIRMIPVR